MMTIYDMLPHDLLGELLAKNAEEATTYQGYIADTGKEDKIFLYPDIFNLSKSFEIKKSDILVCAEAPKSFLPFSGGAILWLKKNSEVISRQTEKPAVTDVFNGFPPTDDETIVVTSGRIVITIPGSIKKYVPPPGKGPCNHNSQ